jgi:hypothetical protein
VYRSSRRYPKTVLLTAALASVDWMFSGYILTAADRYAEHMLRWKPNKVVMWRRMLCATTLSFDLPFTSEHPSPIATRAFQHTASGPYTRSAQLNTSKSERAR